MMQIRIAVANDRKKPRAHEASRFYMMHPELDPRERRRSSNRRQRQDRNSTRLRRSTEEDKDGYSTSRRRGSRSRQSSISSHSSGPQQQRRDRERSASPSRGPKNDRPRRRTPPPKYTHRDPYPVNRVNLGKELFPSGTTKALNGGKELLPNKTVAANLKKELFPTLKSGPGTPNHRRTNSIDATREATDLFASRMTVPFVDGAADSFPLHSDSVQPPAGFSIKGTAGTQSRDGGTGFSIRGAAGDTQSVKELFPTKIGNRGKELFAGRGTRNKADMFY